MNVKRVAGSVKVRAMPEGVLPSASPSKPSSSVWKGMTDAGVLQSVTTFGVLSRVCAVHCMLHCAPSRFLTRLVN